MEAVLLELYKGEQSNYGCIKTEIENLLEELESVKPIKVDKEFCEDVLLQIKNIRLAIMAIS